jgi:hypothetical protein
MTDTIFTHEGISENPNVAFGSAQARDGLHAKIKI